MIEILVVLITLAAAFLPLYAGGAWRARAKEAQKQREADRRAHEVQNDVMLDPVLRERVRRHFDNP